MDEIDPFGMTITDDSSPNPKPSKIKQAEGKITEKTGQGVEIASKPVTGVGKTVKVSGEIGTGAANLGKATGKTVKVTAKGAEVTAQGAQIAAKGGEAVSKVVSGGGSAMVRAGEQLSGSGYGAILGVPTMIVGGLAVGAGKVGEIGSRGAGAVAKGAQKAAQGAQKVGEGIDRTSDRAKQFTKNVAKTGKNIEQKGKDIKEAGKFIKERGRDRYLEGKGIKKSPVASMRTITPGISGGFKAKPVANFVPAAAGLRALPQSTKVMGPAIAKRPDLQRSEAPKSITALPLPDSHSKTMRAVWITISLVCWIVGFIPVVGTVVNIAFWIIKFIYHSLTNPRLLKDAVVYIVVLVAAVLGSIPVVEWLPWSVGATIIIFFIGGKKNLMGNILPTPSISKAK